MNKEFVAWLCGMISSDGQVGCYYSSNGRNPKKYHSGNITIHTSEEDWARQIVSILEANRLSCHLLECHRERNVSRGFRVEFRIDIHKRRPKRTRRGVNQWQGIVDAILEYDLVHLMIPRKWETLQKIAKLGTDKYLARR